MPWLRLDLDEIGRAIQLLAGLAAAGVLEPGLSDEPMTDEALAQLFEGYRYVDELLAQRTEIFSYGRTGHILELNHLVLCGTSREHRRQYAEHLAETERLFYDRPEGIGELHEWFRRNANRAPRDLAGGVFAHVLSAPQLFIEGNARTATLLASYLLARAGLPPLVVTPRWCRGYRDLVGRCSAVERNAFASGLGLTLALRQASGFLASSGEERFLAEFAPRSPAQAADPNS